LGQLIEECDLGIDMRADGRIDGLGEWIYGVPLGM
jgi:hypothetical protein